jgi:hypothetical protein
VAEKQSFIDNAETALKVSDVINVNPPALCTKAVVANCVVFVPEAAVGAAGVPVNVGDARLAFAPNVSLRSAAASTSPAVKSSRIAMSFLS